MSAFPEITASSYSRDIKTA